MTEKTRNPVIAGVILAGGNAQRLGGIPKGTFKLADGISIIEKIILELTKAGFVDIAVSANDQQEYRKYKKQIIPDLRTGIGPLAGIEASLNFFKDRSDAVMFLPCDLPRITTREIMTLKQAFINSDSPVVFIQTSEFFYQPLCAVVHNELANDISAGIEAGVRKPLDLWFKLNAKTVLFESEEPFFNVNSPEDLQVLRRSTAQSFFECKDK